MPEVEQNKVSFGLAEAHWAPVTETRNPTTGAITSSYGDWVSIPGLVSLGQDPQGSKYVFRADDDDYYVKNPNAGYSGPVKFARLPDALREYCFGERRDDNGVGVEAGTDAETKYFAFAFRFRGDKKNIRHEFLKCSITKPSISGETTPEGDTPNVNGEEVTLTSVPRADADKYCHLWADPRTDSTTWENWYQSVYIPTFTPAPEPDPDPDPEQDQDPADENNADQET